MPDRAIVPLVCGGSAGFLCGLMASVLELTGGPMVAVLLAAAAFAAAAGAASTVKDDGDPDDRRTVALYRAGLAAGYASCLYFGMLTFLRDGNLLAAVPLFALGGFLAYCLTQIRIRAHTS